MSIVSNRRSRKHRLTVQASRRNQTTTSRRATRLCFCPTHHRLDNAAILRVSAPHRDFPRRADVTISMVGWRASGPCLWVKPFCLGRAAGWPSAGLAEAIYRAGAGFNHRPHAHRRSPAARLSPGPGAPGSAARVTAPPAARPASRRPAASAAPGPPPRPPHSQEHTLRPPGRIRAVPAAAVPRARRRPPWPAARPGAPASRRARRARRGVTGRVWRRRRWGEAGGWRGRRRGGEAVSATTGARRRGGGWEGGRDARARRVPPPSPAPPPSASADLN